MTNPTRTERDSIGPSQQGVFMKPLEGDLLGRWRPAGCPQQGPRFGLRGQEDAKLALVVFSSHEHALADLTPEFGVSEIGEHHQMEPLQFVEFIVAYDSSHDLAFLFT